ncbi:hypothetical protein GCM10022402_39520 [Salinactinospora qingdaonensis]|uniref:Uncharacterized protein n=1 Tax=Salinactinospora qingdaonensis TaxID=702744 RepID=A0ABP7GCQ0_9ACTN
MISSQQSEAEIERQLRDLKKRYVSDRYIFVPGAEMAELLQHFGARPEDLQELQASGERLDTDPTLSFRRSRSSRYC